MTIRPQPEMVDLQGFRRRGWEFDYQGHTYFIQQIGDLVTVMHKVNGGWQPVLDDEAQRINVVFREELAREE